LILAQHSLDAANFTTHTKEMSITVVVLPFILVILLLLETMADKNCPRFEKGFLDFLTPDNNPGKLFTLNFTRAMETSFGFGKWMQGSDNDGCDQECGDNTKKCNAPGAIRSHRLPVNFFIKA
jgi:hypothetical protein